MEEGIKRSDGWIGQVSTDLWFLIAWRDWRPRLRPMLIRAAFVLSLAFAAPAFAQEGPPDGALVSDRDSYGRVIHLFGDSIMYGWALRAFPHEMTDEQRAAEDWPLRAPASMFNAMLADQHPGMIELDEGGAAVSGALAAAYQGGTFQPIPRNVAGGADEIRDLVEAGVIRDGDIVVFEDAGRHSGDPAEYAENWRMLRDALAGVDVTPVFVTTPDYAEGEGPTVPLYRYDAPFGEGGLSMNDAIRQAADGAVTIELKQLADLAKVRGREPLHTDGIHLNVYGQCLLVSEIAQVAGVGLACP